MSILIGLRHFPSIADSSHDLSSVQFATDSETKSSEQPTCNKGSGIS